MRHICLSIFSLEHGDFALEFELLLGSEYVSTDINSQWNINEYC